MNMKKLIAALSALTFAAGVLAAEAPAAPTGSAPAVKSAKAAKTTVKKAHKKAPKKSKQAPAVGGSAAK
jgi:nitrate reductase cytochrome c-type subunit